MTQIQSQAFSVHPLKLPNYESPDISTLRFLSYPSDLALILFLIIRSHCILWLHLDIQPFWNILQDKHHSFTLLTRHMQVWPASQVACSPPTYLLGGPGHIHLFYHMFSLIMLCRHSFAPQWIYSSVVTHDYTSQQV